MKLQFDGGANPNPGPCAGAYVLLTDDGRPIVEGGVWRPNGTNNIGEYLGLISGLKACVERGLTKVDVEGDSLLVISQVNGRWQVKHPGLIALYQEATSLVKQIETVSLRHIPRAQNAHADRLSDETLERKADWESS